ncbi:hypothetical protein PVAP13_5NG389981 [Panicum virgatum]|uniref:Uncharacterized protein n=1 Tax=Panicum virgatum TaxID=38727 RepID=A0A8T0RU13_PANVG|nr:hypothetical protein PVAP13_5NG389981 [Panicum virgatum]
MGTTIRVQRYVHPLGPSPLTPLSPVADHLLVVAASLAAGVCRHPILPSRRLHADEPPSHDDIAPPQIEQQATTISLLLLRLSNTAGPACHPLRPQMPAAAEQSGLTADPWSSPHQPHHPPGRDLSVVPCAA